MVNIALWSRGAWLPGNRGVATYVLMTSWHQGPGRYITLGLLGSVCDEVRFRGGSKFISTQRRQLKIFLRRFLGCYEFFSNVLSQSSAHYLNDTGRSQDQCSVSVYSSGNHGECAWLSTAPTTMRVRKYWDKCFFFPRSWWTWLWWW
jgi:hypothetical protein